MDQKTTLGTMCRKKEMKKGTHTHRVSNLGPSNVIRLGITVADWEP